MGRPAGTRHKPSNGPTACQHPARLRNRHRTGVGRAQDSRRTARWRSGVVANVEGVRARSRSRAPLTHHPARALRQAAASAGLAPADDGGRGRAKNPAGGSGEACDTYRSGRLCARRAWRRARFAKRKDRIVWRRAVDSCGVTTCLATHVGTCRCR